MTKKKIRAKLQQLKLIRFVKRRRQTGLLRLPFPLSATVYNRFSLLFLAALLLASCTAPHRATGKIMFATPPKVGTWLKSQRELVACQTVEAARYMGDFGFFHPLCVQLLDIGERDYRVVRRETVQLSEGPMWVIHAVFQGQTYFVPLPWHDWL